VVGNKLFNVLTRLLTGLKISDPGTGILCLRLSVVEKMSYLELDSAFHFNPELTLILYEDKSLAIREVPLRWGGSESASNVAPLAYCVRLLRILLRYGFAKYAQGKSGSLAF